MVYFGLYESPTDSEVFVRVETVAEQYECVEEVERERRRERIEDGRGPIAETRIVPAEYSDDLPTHAPEDELMELIRANRGLFPD